MMLHELCETHNVDGEQDLSFYIDWRVVMDPDALTLELLELQLARAHSRSQIWIRS